jgi:hypothetical protein
VKAASRFTTLKVCSAQGTAPGIPEPNQQLFSSLHSRSSEQRSE